MKKLIIGIILGIVLGACITFKSIDIIDVQEDFNNHSYLISIRLLNNKFNYYYE